MRRMYTPHQQRETFHLLFLERLLKVSDPRAFAGEERWGEVVARAFVLVEAAPTGHSGAAP